MRPVFGKVHGDVGPFEQIVRTRTMLNSKLFIFNLRGVDEHVVARRGDRCERKLRARGRVREGVRIADFGQGLKNLQHL